MHTTNPQPDALFETCATDGSVFGATHRGKLVARSGTLCSNPTQGTLKIQESVDLEPRSEVQNEVNGADHAVYSSYGP